MRPKKLIINAFGPYAGKEELDFSLLKENNIFVICGPTGAGKTTIFDAISFALFGEASGKSRSIDSVYIVPLGRHFFPQADNPPIQFSQDDG